MIGDHGPFIELSEDQLVFRPKPKWPGKPKRPVKYLWLLGPSGEKIYKQMGTVSYADYRVGMYYISPFQVRGAE